VVLQPYKREVVLAEGGADMIFQTDHPIVCVS